MVRSPEPQVVTQCSCRIDLDHCRRLHRRMWSMVRPTDTSKHVVEHRSYRSLGGKQQRWGIGCPSLQEDASNPRTRCTNFDRRDMHAQCKTMQERRARRPSRLLAPGA